MEQYQRNVGRRFITIDVAYLPNEPMRGFVTMVVVKQNVHFYRVCYENGGMYYLQTDYYRCDGEPVFLNFVDRGDGNGRVHPVTVMQLSQLYSNPDRMANLRAQRLSNTFVNRLVTVPAGAGVYIGRVLELFADGLNVRAVINFAPGPYGMQIYETSEVALCHTGAFRRDMVNAVQRFPHLAAAAERFARARDERHILLRIEELVAPEQGDDDNDGDGDDEINVDVAVYVFHVCGSHGRVYNVRWNVAPPIAAAAAALAAGEAAAAGGGGRGGRGRGRVHIRPTNATAEVIGCNCPDARSRARPGRFLCKHSMFVAYRVLKMVELDEEIMHKIVAGDATYVDGGRRRALVHLCRQICRELTNEGWAYMRENPIVAGVDLVKQYEDFLNGNMNEEDPSEALRRALGMHLIGELEQAQKNEDCAICRIPLDENEGEEGVGGGGGGDGSGGGGGGNDGGGSDDDDNEVGEVMEYYVIECGTCHLLVHQSCLDRWFLLSGRRAPIQCVQCRESLAYDPNHAGRRPPLANIGYSKAFYKSYVQITPTPQQDQQQAVPPFANVGNRLSPQEARAAFTRYWRERMREHLIEQAQEVDDDEEEHEEEEEEEEEAGDELDGAGDEDDEVNPRGGGDNEDEVRAAFARYWRDRLNRQ